MTYYSYIPAIPLNAYIDDLYFFEGPSAYPTQKVLPVASSNLMINLAEPFQVHAPDQPLPFMTCAESWWVGVWDTYHSVDWPSRVRFFGVHFKPGGAYPFLQFPLSELSSQVVALDAIWGTSAVEIRERLGLAATVRAGFALLEEVLLRRYREAPQNLSIVRQALRQIAQQHGAVSIRELSDQVGFSQNHLGNQFKRFVGITPKEAARFYRFANVLRSLDPASPLDLTRLAHQTQFYDQSHFNHDFLAFTGYSPSEYLQVRRRVEQENPEHAQLLGTLPID